MIDKDLLELLACPVCKGELRYDERKDILICERCRVYYEIKEGIPVLLPDSGRKIEEDNR